MNDKTKQILFLNFLESLEQNDSTLIESIRHGFNVMCENSNARQYTEEYNSRDDSYTLISESPEYIMGLIKESPTLIQVVQSNNIQIQNITKLDISVIIDSAEGQSYYGGSRGSWDDPGEGASFEDGVEAEISGMVAHIYTSDDEIEVEIPETDNAIYNTIKSKVEENDDLYNQLLDSVEEDMANDRADYEADAREARWERDLDRY